jgi:selenide,water dikinase
VVVGGHSIKDKELKYGVAVTGIIDPSRIISNAGAQPGDRLFLTKALGTGIIATAVKAKVVPADLQNLVDRQMAALNRTASELMLQYDVHAATDITGFGLLGHAFEVACASDVSIRFFADQLAILPEAERLAAEGYNPGGANDNRNYLECQVRFDDAVPESLRRVFYDPQTSGGLLIAILPEQADRFATALQDNDLPARVVGEVIPKAAQALIVQPTP